MKEGFAQLRRLMAVVLVAVLVSAWLLPGALAESDILGGLSSMISGLLGG